jgi:hypothetical protein
MMNRRNFLLGGLTVASAGCITENATMKNMPKIKMGQNSDLIPYKTVEAIMKHKCGIYVKKDPVFYDPYYLPVKYDSLVEYTKWFDSFIFTNDINAGDDYDVFDCDDYAQMYKTLIVARPFFSMNHYPPLVGILVAHIFTEWGGVRPQENPYHMLNFAYTEKGMMVIEPQSGKIGKLKDYPNRVIWYSM